MYSKKYKISKAECNQNHTLTISNLFNYLQDIMSRNVNYLGAGSEYHHQRNLAWVFVDYEVNIINLPKQGDIINVGTIPFSFKRFYAFRKYEITDNEGNILVTAIGKFVLINFITKEIVSPSSEVIEQFKMLNKDQLALKISKQEKVDELLLVKEIVVKEKDIDENNHVNNAVYLEYVEDDLHNIETINHIRVTYKKEAVLGDLLHIFKSVDPKSNIYVIKRKEEVLTQISFA
ncbi:hypothetical protein CI105_06215 [Candidatus Izimaplasma bacterium ZiA1]|uniref:acyl-[acyl-carrier-protein] thioesterase n=1 Tax=Candidatus Izimoplasma sp. ZiA1 TaxID=2024899 RepID=UPI000BAA4009|nr:hypothetical protein CI105_06215 [Candidatus Izimaplasma bacterium ZiA1]